MAPKRGENIQLTGNNSVEILERLGDGGQGIVYRVQSSGNEYALKWYKQSYLKGLDERHHNGREYFKQNIQNNIDKGSPNDKFLWPIALTHDIDGSFGYIMKLRPAEYSDFTDIMNTKDKNGNPVNFKNFRASVDSALGVVNAFRALHKKGYFYLDLNDGNFFINTTNGDVLICDNDNVTASPKYSLGKPGYIAPELVSDINAKSNALTDAHSLGVVLFRLFMRHDPFMGKKYCASVVMTAQKMIELYGTEPVFIFDPDNNSNRPVQNIHANPLRLWPIYPTHIQDAFIQTFCKGIMSPNKRLTEKEWSEIILRLRDDILTCSCATDILWINKAESARCPKCGVNLGIPYHIVINDYRINLFPGNIISSTHIDDDFTSREVYGLVVANKQDPSKWGLQNKSTDLWSVKRPNGEIITVAEGKVIPIVPKAEIELPGGRKFVIEM